MITDTATQHTPLGGSSASDLLVSWHTVRWLLDRGVPSEMAPQMVNLRVVDRQLAFYEETSDDVVLWHIEAGRLTSLAGRAFALGEGNIGNAGSYAFDTSLVVHVDPLNWLRDKGRGIVVLRWSLAFDMLRDAPRVAVAESMLPLYRRHMRPGRLPELAVLTERKRAA